MTEKKKKEEEKVNATIVDQSELEGRVAQLTQTAQNLANQLNQYMGLASQYEGTISAMTQRLQEKDNIIAQLNSRIQGGE